MSSKRYADEFKIEAVKQVTERGHADGFSPVQFEEKYFTRLESVY